MSYNVSVMDADGCWFTAYVAPDRPPRFDDSLVATNHQEGVKWDKYAQAVSTEERWQLLTNCIADASENEQRFIGRFLQPPVFSDNYSGSFGTLYTAVYNPRDGVVDYLWQDRTLRQSLDNFEEGALTIDYPQAAVV
jgi:predicted choloylglycine hydrolase